MSDHADGNDDIDKATYDELLRIRRLLKWRPDIWELDAVIEIELAHRDRIVKAEQ